uniref:Serine aminopeptidase S33 domain-containing protein n=1 Tax=Salix viminalis TaxID=40686 RepID=A0A6N2MB95_SALVM
MAATGGCVAFSTLLLSCKLTPSPSSGNLRPNQSRRRFAVSSESQFTATVRNETKRTTSFGENGIFKEKDKGKVREGVSEEKPQNPYGLERERNESEEDTSRKSLKDYFEESKDLIGSEGGGGGPPRWFSPLDCGSRLDNSPLLLYLPGIDGVGLGLIMHHQSLGKIFDIWCLHIPVKDRTSFTDLVKLVEQTVRSENFHSPNRPIYLVGESLGACLALAVAARNPDIDLSLILANPGTSFEKSQLQPLIPLLEILPIQYQLSLSYMLSSMTGDPLRMAMDKVMKGPPLQQAAEGLSKDVVAMSSYVRVLANILPKETLLWKLKMLKSASAFANSRLHAVKAQTLLLTSGRDQLLPSEDEGKRLRHALPKCEIRRFNNNGHYIFLEDGVDLVTVIKGASFYRRGKCHDYVFDYIPPTPSEFRNICESNRLFMRATSPVMLSTLKDGMIVKGLAGIPSEGPVLFIGYHMLLGFELVPMVTTLLMERNILMRGIAHPMMFMRKKEGNLPELSSFDTYRIMGAAPVSGNNLYKLLSSKAHVLLYPGGLREACHRKGEQYKLIWPEQSEFVRMASRFGAKIVPFGVVGEDDFGEVVFDYDDQMKIPFLKDFIKELSEEADTVRTGLNSEVNQDIHSPVVLPKFPGRFYYYFGKPIETEGCVN